MKILSKMCLIPLSACLLSMTAMADTIMNQVGGLYDPTLAPTAQMPVLCVQNGSGSKYTEWDYGQALDPNAVSGNDYYWGAAVRLGGCSEQDIYFGWLNVSGATVTYAPPTGSHIILLDPAITSEAFTGTLGYTQIGVDTGSDFPTNPSSLSPEQTTWFAGINLSGFEFSTMPNATVIPNLSEEDKDTSYSDLVATGHFLTEGANIVRLPLRWAYVKPYGPEGSTTFDSAYFTNLYIPALQTIITHGYYAIVDLHAYMHYATVGNQVAGCSDSGPCPDGTLDTNADDYVNTWLALWQNIQKYPEIKPDHLFFDLVNEPANRSDESPLTPQQAFDTEVAVIKALQEAGYPGYILVEGSDWTGLHSWEDSGNAAQFSRENFNAAGINDLSHIIINVHQYLDSNYSGTQTTCLQDLSTTGPGGFNLQAFVDYLQTNQLKAMVTEFGVGSDQASCTQPLKDLLDYLYANSYTTEKGYGFIGWTAWSTGHGWGNYNLVITPDDWKDAIISPYFGLQQ